MADTLDPFAAEEQTGLAMPFESGTAQKPRSSIFSDPREDDRLTSGVARAKQKAPDQAARLFRLQAKTGLPTEVIERNIDEVEREASRADFDPEQFRKTSPLLAAWLAEHPDHAALAQDDLRPLSGIEKALRIAGNAPRSIAAGVSRMTVGAWGAMEALADVDPSGFLDADFARESRRVAQQLTERVRARVEGAGPTERAIYGGFESIGLTASLAPLALTPGGATAMLSSLGLVTGGEAYGEARDAGKGVLTSLAYGVGQGVIEVLTERIPVVWFLGDMAKHTGLLKMATRQLAAEIPGEQIATLLQDLNTWAVMNPEQPFTEYLAERPGAAYQTLVSTLVAVGGQTSAVRILDRVANGGKPTPQRVIEKLTAATTESKLRERSPEKFAELVEQATRETGLEEIEIPVESFTTYFQKRGENPEAVAEQWTGDTQAYARAAATGGTIAIPTARYITQVATSEHAPFVAMEARLDPTGMSAREELEYEARVDATMRAQAGVTDDPADALRDELTARAVRAGFDPSTAATYATALAEAFVNVGQRANLNLPDVVKAWLPEIRAVGLNRSRVQRAPLSAKLSLDLEDAGRETAGRTGPEDAAAERAAVGAEGDALAGGVRPSLEARAPADIPAAYRPFFDQLIADARTRGFAGTDQELAGAYIARVDAARELSRDLQQLSNETDSAGLLQAIADGGGINFHLEGVGGMQGELNQLQEDMRATFSAKFTKSGNYAKTRYMPEARLPGITGPIITRVKPMRGQKDAKFFIGKVQRKPGLSLDGMLEYLTLERGFQFDDLSDMLQSIFDAVSDYQTGGSDFAADVLSAMSGGLGVQPGVDWWTSTLLQGGLFDAPEPTEDTLDTGEKQPRLPGAEDVRETEVTSPEFDAPWSLTSEVARAKKGKQDTLFQRSIDVTRSPQFQAWFGDSVLVDDAGRPSVLYHGTSDSIDAFDFDHPNRQDTGWLGTGVYLTSAISVAESYAKNKSIIAADRRRHREREQRHAFEIARELGDDDVPGEAPKPTPTGAHIMPLFARLENPYYATLADKNAFMLIAHHNGKAEAREKADDWTRQLKAQGYDGVILRYSAEQVGERLVGALEVVVFDPAGVKSAIGNRGTFAADDPKVLYQRTLDVKELLIQHNLTAANLRHADKMGGIPVPSLAVVKKSQPLTNFGEITLIGPREMADPSGYARTQVFGADVYSPRYPTIHFDISNASQKAVSALYRKHKDATGLDYYDLDELQKRGAEYFERNSAPLMAEFLEQQGIPFPEKAIEPDRRYTERIKFREAIDDAGLTEQFRTFAQVYFEKLNPTERIFKGFTNQGNRSYQAHTLENVVRILKKELRGGETSGNIYGVWQLRARFTPKFRSLKGIKAAKELLVSKEAFEQVRKEIDTEFFGIGALLAPYNPASKESFRYTDSVMAVMEDARRLGLPRALKEYGFEDVPDDIATKVLMFLEKLRHLPTEYFEAKILREVDLAEFKAAVVPEDVDPEALAVLHARGVEVFTYKRGVVADRKVAIESAAEQVGEDVLFQKTRGAISFRDVEPPLIRLFNGRNLSTLWHESGHLFLRMMGTIADDLAARDQATLTTSQAKLVSDYRDVLLPWLGAKTTADVGEAEQEQMARGWEAFMLEGKAPSADLRRVFARARAWLLQIYRDVKGLSRDAGFSVVLNDDVRAVFDRLLATDEAIAAAKAESEAVPLFTTAEEAGWTPAVFAAYQQQMAREVDQDRERIQQEIMRELAREQKATWKAERERVREEIAADVYRRREYEALAVITKGTHADGTRFNEDVEPIPMKLSRQAVVRTYGKEAVAGMPRGSLTTDADGLHPDAAAELTGYDTGAELLTELRDLPKMNRVIDEETDAEMKRRHGDLVLDGRLADRAREAVMLEDGRAKVVEAELRALARKARQINPALRAQAGEERSRVQAGRRLLTQVPTRATMARVAERHINTTTLGQIRPLRYFQAARTAATKAMDLVAAKDYQGALQAKTQHLLNLELYRKAVEAQEAVDALRTTAGRMFKPDGQVAKTRNMDMVTAARAIVARYFFPGRADDAFKALHKVREYDPGLYESLIEKVTAATEQGDTLRGLTFEQFVGMRDAVTALWAMARTSEQIVIAGEKRQRGEVIGELTDRLDDLQPELFKGPRSPNARALLGARAWLRRVESWADYMDGGKPDGVFRRYFWEPISNAADTFRAAWPTALQQYLDIVLRVEGTLTPGKIDAPELGHVFQSRAELLHALLHTGNASNLQKLLRGSKWGQFREDGTLDDSRWREFERRAWEDGTLTEADYDFAQQVWNLFDSFKADAQRAHREMYGHEFHEITAAPFETPWGTYRGGYVPAKADPLQSADADMRAEQHLLSESDNTFAFPTTGRGATKSRTEGYAAPLQLDLAVLPQHLNWVLRFIHIEPRVKDVARLVFDRRFRARIDNYDPSAVKDMLIPWLQRAATQRVSRPGAWAPADRFFRAVRSRTGLNIMTANAVNILQQFTGLFLGAIKVKPRYLRNALWSYVQNPKAVARFVHDNSAMMRGRSGPQVVEMQQRLEGMLLNPTKYQKVREFAEQHGYFGQIAAQNIIDNVLWAAGYEQATENGADHQAAVRQADAPIRQTQGSFAPEDMSRVETQTAFVRLFTMFYGFFNMHANLLGTEFGLVVRDMGVRKGAGRALYVYTMGFMLVAVLSEVIKQSLGGWDADDDDSYIDEAMWIFFGSQARFLTAFVPGGQVGLAAGHAWNDKPYDDRVSLSPAVSAIEATVQTPRSVYEAITDPEKSKKRAIRDTLSLIGLITGLPVAPLGRPLGYAADVAVGDEEPEGADVVRGLLTGRSQRER